MNEQQSDREDLKKFIKDFRRNYRGLTPPAIPRKSTARIVHDDIAPALKKKSTTTDSK